MCFGAEAKPCDATTKSPPEGKSPARDESRTTAEPITLDAFFKVFKESLEIQNQRFDELITRMDVIDQRYKDQDRRFQEQDQHFEHREQPFQRRDENSVEIKEDFGRNCKTGALPGQQARPEGEDAYSEESGESEDDSTADGRKGVTPSRKLGKEPDLVQQTFIGQHENNPVTISRHVASDNDGVPALTSQLSEICLTARISI